MSMSRPVKPACRPQLAQTPIYSRWVRNLSNIGACPQVLTTVGTPAIFQFMMPNQTPQTYKLMWRDYTSLGVHFRSDASILPDDVENTSSDLESVA